ncbi:MAG: hypothetical protein ACC657_00790 [Thiohalomonadales bacterium]
MLIAGDKKYTITFSGDICKDSSIESVINKIAALFDISPSEVTPIFDGTKQFQRCGLNEFTAKYYVKKFKKIGAVCLLKPDKETKLASIKTNTITTTQPIQTVTNKNSCPKCQSLNIDTEKCFDCGIYFEKYNSRMSQTSKNDQINISQQVIRDDDDNDEHQEILEYKSKAIRIIKYAAFYLIAIFTLDNYTDSNREALRFVIGPDFDVGFFPYLLGNIALAWGSYYLALVKGRSGYWGLLGLISLPGLCVLLLLTDKNKISSKIDTKVQAFSYFIIILSIIWAANILFLTGDESAYIAKGLALREQRHEYPETEFDSESKLFHQEINELNRYLDEGFTLLLENNFDHSQINRIGDAMFSETIRLFIWINYQRYLQFRNGGSGAAFLETESIKQQQIKIFTKIQDAVRKVSQTSFNKSFSKWFTGGSDTDYKEIMSYAVFFKEEFQVRQIIRELTLMKELPFDPPEFYFDDIKLPTFTKALVDKMVVEDDKLLFTFSTNAFQLSGKTLVLGYFYDVYQVYDINEGGKVDRYFLQTVQLTADFPSYLIFGDIGVFDLRNTAPLIDRSLR